MTFFEYCRVQLVGIVVYGRKFGIDLRRLPLDGTPVRLDQLLGLQLGQRRQDRFPVLWQSRVGQSYPSTDDQHHATAGSGNPFPVNACSYTFTHVLKQVYKCAQTSQGKGLLPPVADWPIGSRETHPTHGCFRVRPWASSGTSSTALSPDPR